MGYNVHCARGTVFVNGIDHVFGGPILIHIAIDYLYETSHICME